MLGRHLLHDRGVGHEDFHLDTVTLAILIDYVVGLLRHPARVDGEDADAGIDLVRHVYQRAAVGLEAATYRQLSAEPVYCPCQNFLRLLVVELDSGFTRLQLIHDKTWFGLPERFIELWSCRHGEILGCYSRLRLRRRRRLCFHLR